MNEHVSVVCTGTAGLRRALHVGLDHANAGQVLLNEVADIAEVILDRPEARVHDGRHTHDEEAHQWQGDEHQQRQPPVDTAHWELALWISMERIAFL